MYDFEGTTAQYTKTYTKLYITVQEWNLGDKLTQNDSNKIVKKLHLKESKGLKQEKLSWRVTVSYRISQLGTVLCCFQISIKFTNEVPTELTI